MKSIKKTPCAYHRRESLTDDKPSSGLRANSRVRFSTVAASSELRIPFLGELPLAYLVLFLLFAEHIGASSCAVAAPPAFLLAPSRLANACSNYREGFPKGVRRLPDKHIVKAVAVMPSSAHELWAHSCVPLFRHIERVATTARASTVVLAAEAKDHSGYIETDTAGDTSNVTGVTLKMAFDSSPVWGVADLSDQRSERFTSPESLDMVHRLRRESSCVLVGRGTVERDDCSLNVRRVELKEGQQQPVRVVLDPSLKLLRGNREYALLRDGLPTLIYFSKQTFGGESNNNDGEFSLAAFPDLEDSVTLIGLTPRTSSSSGEIGSLSLPLEDVVKDLTSRGLHHVMVEGGPATARGFLEAGVVDRAIIVKAPIQFQIPVPAGINEDKLKGVGLENIGSTNMDGDAVEYWSRPGLDWPADSDVLSSWP